MESEYIMRFYIEMHDPIVVQNLQSLHYLSRNTYHYIDIHKFVSFSIVLNNVVQITAC